MKPGRTVFAFFLFVLCVRGAPAQDKLIAEGDEWRIFKGTEEPPEDWTAVGFDDSGWIPGATPIGYGTDLNFQTVLADMQNGYLAVYCRKSFDIADPAQVK